MYILEKVKYPYSESSEAGFTLWELLIVIVLMGFILQSLSPNYRSGVDHLKQEIDQANIREIEGAAQVYRIDMGIYPASLVDLLEQPDRVSNWRGPYLKEWPVNPWDGLRPYQMDSTGHVVSGR